MVRREPGEFGGKYHRVMPEGSLTAHDGAHVRTHPDREGLDLNCNFQNLWRMPTAKVLPVFRLVNLSLTYTA
jgi:hypothetical protein